MNRPTLDDLLTSTASSLTYPATPDLTSRVAARLNPPAQKRFLPPPRALAYVIAVLVLALALILAVSPSREALARLFGVQGSTIEVVPDLESTTGAQVAQPQSLFQAGTPGRVVELADLLDLTGFAAVLPEVPDERIDSLAVRYGTQWVAIHRYGSFHLWQTRLEDEASFGKFVTPDSILLEVLVNDADGVWLSGNSHVVYYRDGNGNVIPDSSRVVEASTLIWRTDAFFYRIETDLPLEEALRIAETLP